MEALRLQLADLERRWEDDHRQLVRLAAAGDRMHDAVQRESGSALDLQFAAAAKRVRMSAQDAGTEGKTEELALKELVHGVVVSQQMLTENVASQQTTIQRHSTQQGELLQAVALTPMRHENRKGSKQPLNDKCWYCQRKGHIKRDCVALKRTRRNTAELASIARRHRGRRRGDTTPTRRTVVADDTDTARLKQRQSFRESSTEARQQTFAKQRAMLLAEHATALLVRDSELETLEEKCRCLTQQLKAALHTHVLEEKRSERLQVECNALKETKEDNEKKQHADERRKRITDACDAYVRRSIGETERVDEDIPGTVELCGRLDHERHLCVRLDEQTSHSETLHTAHKRNTRYTGSPDEGICASTGDNGDADDVNETTREIAESRRHTESERHQPTTLTGRPRRLLGTQDRSAVVNTRRRCLPCVPAREANIDMSAEEVRDVLVRALERSSGERSSSTDTLPETTREATDDDEPVYELDEQPIRRRSTTRGAGHHSNPYGLPRSAWAQ